MDALDPFTVHTFHLQYFMKVHPNRVSQTISIENKNGVCYEENDDYNLKVLKLRSLCCFQI